MSEVRGPSGERTLAEKIEWLIGHMWPADVPPRTNADVAEALTAATGEEMSSTSIWKLRTGRGGNPTFKTLTALATFFQVPFGYFGEGEDGETAGDQAALLAVLRDAGVSRDALRTLADLSPTTRQLVMDVIASAARMERSWANDMVESSLNRSEGSLIAEPGSVQAAD
jgi:transcriptional regulator with XRE-family HTH domain